MRYTAVSCFAAVTFASCISLGCETPKPSPGGRPASTQMDAPVPLSFGATEGQARVGGTATFVLESTPNLLLHASLEGAQYDGQVLQIEGTDSGGAVVWRYTHLQKGASFDAVLPVFGSEVARKHKTGAYSFTVVAPDRAVVPRGAATVTKTKGAPHADDGT